MATPLLQRHGSWLALHARLQNYASDLVATEHLINPLNHLLAPPHKKLHVHICYTAIVRFNSVHCHGTFHYIFFLPS